MAEKKIVTIGFKLASDKIDYLPFGSKQSLLDWDIIICQTPILREQYGLTNIKI